MFRLILFLLTLLSTIARGNEPSSFTPVEDPVYDLLEQGAARGLLPLSPILHQPLMRTEIYNYLLKLREFQPDSDDYILQQDIDYYLLEYKNATALDTLAALKNPDRLLKSWLHPFAVHPSPPWRGMAVDSKNFQLTLDPVVFAQYNLGAAKDIVKKAWGVQFFGCIQPILGYYFRFVDHTESGNGPYFKRRQLDDEHYGYVGPLLGGSETYYDLSEAYLTAAWRNWEFVLGKDRVKWGEASSGGLLLSGDYPSFNHFRFRTELTKSLNFQYLIGKLQALELPGDTMYQTPEGWTRRLSADKWVAAHRLEVYPSDWLAIGLSEAIVWGERGIDPAYVNPLNFFWSCEHDGGDQDNVLIAVDAAFRIKPYALGYASLLIDDLSASTIGKGNPNNKVAWEGGIAWLQIPLPGVELRINYTRIEPYVYSHFFPVNSYTTWTSTLGGGLPANSDRLAGEVKYRPRRFLELGLQIEHLRQGSVGQNPDEPVPKIPSLKVHFLEGLRSEWTSWEAYIQVEPWTGLFIRCGQANNYRRNIIPNRTYASVSYRY